MKRNLLLFARVGAMMFACYLLLGEGLAQQPSPAAVTLGRELVELKGGAGMFDPIVVNVVEQTKAALLQYGAAFEAVIDAAREWERTRTDSR